MLTKNDKHHTHTHTHTNLQERDAARQLRPQADEHFEDDVLHEEAGHLRKQKTLQSATQAAAGRGRGEHAHDHINTRESIVQRRLGKHRQARVSDSSPVPASTDEHPPKKNTATNSPDSHKCFDLKAAIPRARAFGSASPKRVNVLVGSSTIWLMVSRMELAIVVTKKTLMICFTG